MVSGGICLATLGGGDRVFKEINHTKAHRTIDHNTSELDKFRITVNAHADVYAKRGATSHEPVEGDIRVVQGTARRWADVFRVAVAALSLFPSARESQGKLTRAANFSVRAPGVGGLPPAARRNPHRFYWNGRLWVCQVCKRFKSSPNSLIDRVPCGELPPGILAMRDNPRGHKVFIVVTYGDLDYGVCCRRCGAFAFHRFSSCALSTSDCPGAGNISKGARYRRQLFFDRKHPQHPKICLYPPAPLVPPKGREILDWLARAPSVFNMCPSTPPPVCPPCPPSPSLGGDPTADPASGACPLPSPGPPRNLWDPEAPLGASAPPAGVPRGTPWDLGHLDREDDGWVGWCGGSDSEDELAREAQGSAGDLGRVFPGGLSQHQNFLQ